MQAPRGQQDLTARPRDRLHYALADCAQQGAPTPSPQLQLHGAAPLADSQSGHALHGHRARAAHAPHAHGVHTARTRHVHCKRTACVRLQMPKGRDQTLSRKQHKPHILALPHPARTLGECDVVLFTKDPQREYKDKLAAAQVERVKVIGIDKLRKKYVEYEAKRNLCSGHAPPPPQHPTRTHWIPYTASRCLNLNAL